jgi:hypothetical protein
MKHAAFFAACARLYTADHLSRCHAARHGDRSRQAMLAWIPDWWRAEWRKQQAWIETTDKEIRLREQRPAKRCAICARKFRPENYHAMFCSDACRKAAKRQYEATPQRRQYHRERGREYRAKRRTVLNALREIGIIQGYDIVEHP